jgi:hypothetical protein
MCRSMKTSGVLSGVKPNFSIANPYPFVQTTFLFTMVAAARPTIQTSFIRCSTMLSIELLALAVGGRAWSSAATCHASRMVTAAAIVVLPLCQTSSAFGLHTATANKVSLLGEHADVAFLDTSCKRLGAGTGKYLIQKGKQLLAHNLLRFRQSFNSRLPGTRRTCTRTSWSRTFSPPWCLPLA